MSLGGVATGSLAWVLGKGKRCSCFQHLDKFLSVSSIYRQCEGGGGRCACVAVPVGS
jgi:hypothetical protein